MEHPSRQCPAHSEHLTYNVSYQGGWVALWTPAATAGGGLIATLTVTPRASATRNPAVEEGLRTGRSSSRIVTQKFLEISCIRDLTDVCSPSQICHRHLKGVACSSTRSAHKVSRSAVEWNFHKRISLALKSLDFHKRTFSFEGDSLMDICILKDKMLEALLMCVEQGPLSEGAIASLCAASGGTWPSFIVWQVEIENPPQYLILKRTHSLLKSRILIFC